jgi:hypothetical protein
VRHLLRDRRNRALIASILVPGLCAAPSASAEIFKCVAKDGTALYQNFPCQFDSLGWLPSGSPPAATPTSTPANAGQAKPNAPTVNAASTVQATHPGEPRIGMTTDEVRALLGQPEEMVEDEPASGRVSTWRYADGRSVQFDNKHRVFGVQR